jgi:polyhydroxybutyrate depolymerase
MLTAVLSLWIFLAIPAPDQQSLQTYTLIHDGLLRTYHVHLPPGYRPDRSVPLVLALHGGGGSGSQLDGFTNSQFTREGDRRGWVIVFPEGIDRGWNDGRDPESEAAIRRSGVDDVGFMRTLIERLRSDFGIDQKRVYATGISNGGFMSLRLAIDLSDRIAAVGAVASCLGTGHRRLEPRAPVGVLIMNGTQDPLVPYEGGRVEVLGEDRGSVLSTDETIRWWVAKMGCDSEPSRRTLPDRAPRDGTHTEVETYSGCRGGVQVALYRIEGGGHTWPGGMQYLPIRWVGRVSRDFEAASEIFDFFEKHRR